MVITMTFVMRTSKPTKGNKYYIRKVSGGYSNAIQGYPKDNECDVLSNCVGYAYGRFNEIGNYEYCKYLAPTNAENFMQYKGSCETGQTPKLGACMVWQKGKTLSGKDGAGHVAIVEKVISETEVYTSESGYGSKAFWNQTRKKGEDGNWGAGSGYTFLGFIYNPAITENCSINTVNVATPEALKKGSIVKITSDATYYGRTNKVPMWILKKDWIVSSISGDRAVIDKSVDGKNSICSPIHVKYLTLSEKSNAGHQKEDFKAYVVKVNASALNVRKGAGTNYKIVGCIRDKGTYTIVEEKTGAGAKKWGRLKSGTGWISLDYVQEI